jgi:hypothetical protein
LPSQDVATAIFIDEPASGLRRQRRRSAIIEPRMPGALTEQTIGEVQPLPISEDVSPLIYNRIERPKEEVLAISVRRQRKLKMKKHKYKKLMKRTRNLRRKLGKI